MLLPCFSCLLLDLCAAPHVILIESCALLPSDVWWMASGGDSELEADSGVPRGGEGAAAVHAAAGVRGGQQEERHGGGRGGRGGEERSKRTGAVGNKETAADVVIAVSG